VHIGFDLVGAPLSELPRGTRESWIRWNIVSTRTGLSASLALLLAGPLLINHPQLHGDFMLLGINLFYIFIMLNQHVGFTRLLPSKYSSITVLTLSLIWVIMYVVNLWVWSISLIILIAYYVLLLYRGLGRIPLLWPNWFTLVGLLGMVPISPINPFMLISYPLASVISLMRRVEGKQRMRYADIPYMAAYPFLMHMNSRESIILLLVLTLIVLGLPTRNRGRGILATYWIGSMLGRAGLLITLVLAALGSPNILMIHALALGFIAVIMVSLCIPMLVPGILWISIGRYGPEIPMLTWSSSIARILASYSWSLFVVSEILLYSALILAALSYARGKRVIEPRN